MLTMVQEVLSMRVGEKRSARIMAAPRSEAYDTGLEGALTNGLVSQDGTAGYAYGGRMHQVEMRLLGVDERQLNVAPSGMEWAIFSCGSFWSAELAFRRVLGVEDVRVGYVGGSTRNPMYEEVVAGIGGHTEAVAVLHSLEMVPFGELLHTYWEVHGSATTRLDDGEHHRAAMHCITSEQYEMAREAVAMRNARMGRLVGVEVRRTTLDDFYIAEEYHQR